MILSLLYILLSVLAPIFSNEPPDSIKKEIVTKINEVREKGCKCGNKYFLPAKPLKWNSTLFSSALDHAQDMYNNNFFDHYSSNGLNIGQRLDKFGYYWQQAGENLGEGQKSFEEVMRDWIKSPSHCEMLMNPKVDEVAVAKYKNYWVQHFGKKIPPGAKRVVK